MKLLSNWREIVKKAWSMRAAALATVLSGLAVALPMISAEGWENWLAAGAFFSTVGAFLASIGVGITRVVDQGIASGVAPDHPDDPTFI